MQQTWIDLSIIILCKCIKRLKGRDLSGWSKVDESAMETPLEYTVFTLGSSQLHQLHTKDQGRVRVKAAKCR